MKTLKQSYMHGVWVWGPGEIYNENSTIVKNAVNTLVNFATKPFGQISEPYDMLFITARFVDYKEEDKTSKYDSLPTITQGVNDPLTDPINAAKLRSVLKTLHENGVKKIEYLYGDTYSIFDKAAMSAYLGPIETLQSVIAFNKGTTDPKERFDGFHDDIEPHTMIKGPYANVWFNNRLDCGYNKDITANWQSVLTQQQTLINEYNTGWCATTPECTKMTLAQDIGTDLAYYNQPMWQFFNTPLPSVPDVYPVQYLGIMNYYDSFTEKNNAGSYLHGSKAEPGAGGMIQNLNATSLTRCSVKYDNTGPTWKVPIMLGSETGPTSIAPASTSFWGEGYYALAKMKAQAMQQYEQSNYKGALAGFLTHHYGSMVAITKKDKVISANPQVSCKISPDTPAVGSYTATINSTDTSSLCINLVRSDTKESMEIMPLTPGKAVTHVVTATPPVLDAIIKLAYNPVTGACSAANDVVAKPIIQAPKEIYVSFNQAASSCVVSTPTMPAEEPAANMMYFVYHQATDSCTVSSTPVTAAPIESLAPPPMTAEVYLALDPASGGCDYHFYSIPCTI